MRLIDADVMIDILRKSHESHATNSREENLLDRDIRLVKEQAKYHPVIIEQRPHGEWIRHIDDLYPEESTEECSVCHEEQRITGNDDNFCPKCGADMRKESDPE